MILGIDLGGTRIKAGVLTEEGHLKDSFIAPTQADEGAKKVLKNLAEIIEGTKEKYPIKAIGLAVASPLDPETGVLYNPPNLPFGTFNIKEYLEASCKLPVVIENDANAFVLGEWWKGAGRGSKVLLGITLGTGIGGGLIVDGDIWHGAHGIGGEFGHITIQKDGPLCNCGRRGCFEAMASSKFLAETYQRLCMTQETLTPKEIYEKAIKGDTRAIEAFNILARNIAVGLSSLCNALDPDTVLIGGGLANAGMLLLEQVRMHFDPLLLPGIRGKVKLTLAQLKDTAAVFGVAYKAIKAMGR